MKNIALFIMVLLFSACAPEPEAKPLYYLDRESGAIRTVASPAPSDPLLSALNADHAPRSKNSLSMEEVGRLRQQIAKCWGTHIGKTDKDIKYIVSVRITVSPERQILSAAIVDEERYNKNPDFRAFADSVIRSLNTPLCKTLDLPLDRYDIWKDIVIDFGPVILN